MVQIFFGLIESEISGQKHVCNALTDISALILCMSCHTLTLMGCCFCHWMFICNWKIHYFCGKASCDFTPFCLLVLSSRQPKIKSHASLSVNPFHGKKQNRNKNTTINQITSSIQHMVSFSFNWRFNCQREREAVEFYNVNWITSMNKIIKISKMGQFVK